MDENRMPGAYRPVTPPGYSPPRPSPRVVAARAKRQRRNRILTAVSLCAVFVIGLVLGRFAMGGGSSAADGAEETLGEIPVYSRNSLPVAPNIKYYSVPLSHSLQEYIYEVCLDEQVPMSLIIGMIDHESHFTPDIVSDTGDMGLMQLNTINYGYLEEQYHCADPLNPYQNVFCGIKIVGSYLQKYRSYNKALMAYNMGEYGAQKAWDEGYSSSSYSTGIIALAEQYEDEVGQSANGLGLGLYSS